MCVFPVRRQQVLPAVFFCTYIAVIVCPIKCSSLVQLWCLVFLFGAGLWCDEMLLAHGCKGHLILYNKKHIYFKIMYFHDWKGMLTLNVENIKPLGTTEIFLNEEKNTIKISMSFLISIYTEMYNKNWLNTYQNELNVFCVYTEKFVLLCVL